MRAFARASRPARAVTFIELMFVVVILGIMAAVAAPRLTGGGANTALRTTARDMAKLASYARQVAISRQQPATMTLHLEEGVWYVDLPYQMTDRERRRAEILDRRGRPDPEDREPRTDEEETKYLHPRLRFGEFLRDGETVREDVVEIVFWPNGSSTGGSVILETNREKRMTVYVERSTGMAMATLGEPKDFAAMLEEAGLDVSKYEGVETAAIHEEATGRAPGEGFYRSAGSSEERVAAYADVAARIMGRASQRFEQERQQQQMTGGAAERQDN